LETLLEGWLLHHTLDGVAELLRVELQVLNYLLCAIFHKLLEFSLTSLDALNIFLLVFLEV
jgi:hypothetical protein